MSPPNARIPELDGLRGLAILLVLIWHYSEFIPLGSDVVRSLPLVGLSWSGVDLFFVLSGFLLGGILLDNRTSSTFWTTFYIRRAARILPLYLAVISVFLVLVLISPINLKSVLAETIPLWSYPIFVQNIAMTAAGSFGSVFMGPTWSLAVEEQFYLVLPFIIRFIPSKLLPWMLCFAVIISPLFRIVIFHWFSDHVVGVYVLLPSRSDALILGVLAAWAVRNLPTMVSNRRIMVMLLAVFSVGVVIIGVTFSGFAQRGMIFFGYSWMAAFYTTLLVYVVTNASFLSRLSMWAPLRRLGSIAFGVYLFHLPVLGILYAIVLGGAPTKISSLSGLFVIFISISTTLLLAKVSFVLFENPINSKARSWSSYGRLKPAISLCSADKLEAKAR